MRIGAHLLPNNVFAAPMAGVTDRPFRKLCKALGAGYAVSEMVTSRKELWNSLKTSRRADHSGEPGPIAVQIAGTDAAMMAEAAVYNIERGAQIIDINMGCPAKKVCNKWAGSALMQDEALALEIAEAVVAACEPHGVPVTLKMRTGWCQANKNAVTLACAFEGAGIRMLTVHGRTREQGYGGQAEYDTIAAVKAAVRVPVVANGDITSPEKARAVLAHTGADAVMIGRAAQGRPWIFREVAHYLATGEHLAPPLVAEVKRLLLDHLQEHYALYGDDRWAEGLAARPDTLTALPSASTGVQPGTSTGVRSARKHIGWYVRGLPGGEAFRARMNALDDSRAQWQAVADYFDELGAVMDRLPAADAAWLGPVEEAASA
ncbi:NifR3 family TIM-barrel protein [Hylemonella gracilis ATCC 19624]|uniref:tRNA-dihydrouridine synthase B n=1 Tax=Hylemonella gracilis ATCC 19624 TaxID=887062 RepID=F3KUC0_9BURK|nr:NifR3 family TIM-barrel protein [Hylemonella gracilis ATCC 19624]